MSGADPEPIPFHRPSLGDAERAAVLEVLDSGWLTTGGRAAAFESAFAAYVGASHAVAVNRATAALHLALEGLGVEGGRSVYVGDGNSSELPGAKAHGMTTVWVDNGDAQHWRHEFVPEGDFAVTDLREIPSILARCAGRQGA